MKSSHHVQLTAVSNWTEMRHYQKRTVDPPTSLLLTYESGSYYKWETAHLVYLSVCTCRAPFLLKEDTHCIRRHISSATDSTILDKTRGTRSFETVKTWSRKKESLKKEKGSAQKKGCLHGCLYLGMNGYDVYKSFLQVVPHAWGRRGRKWKWNSRKYVKVLQCEFYF